MEKQAIIKLTENFFKTLKCDINWNNNLLTITKVPQDFEKLYEKSSPYIFSFDEETHKNNSDSELITRGSLIIKLMTTYLENKAQTTILKINFQPDLKQIIKDNIDLKIYEIANISAEEKNDYIFRFIFMTTLQYLNEKEQIMTQIYINNNQILENLDINKYPTTSGIKEEKKKEKELMEETKANFNIAKENLKIRLQKKTKEITDELSISLEKALERINSHYSHMIKELEKEHNKDIENLESSRQKLPKTNEKNKQIIIDRIKRLEETIKNSKIKQDLEKLEKEKQFFLTDEKHKHSINLNNSLMNTTVIYYPIFNIKLFLKDKKSQLKELKFTYNPLKKQLSKIFCDSCKKEIKDIILCDSGHLSCKECIQICPRCQRKTCKSCTDLKCNVCSGKICEKCATQCTNCKKYTCNSDIKKIISEPLFFGCSGMRADSKVSGFKQANIPDIRKDESTSRYICSSCSEFCNSCNKFSSKSSFRQCEECRKKFCINCIKSKYVNGKTMKLCTSCANNVKPVKIDFRRY